MAREAGTAISDLPLYQAKDVWEVEPHGDKIRREYIALYAAWRGNAPLIGSAHPLAPLVTLQRAVATQIRPGDRCRVTLYYEQTSISATVAPPATEYADNGSTILTDLRSNPRYAEVSEADRATINDWIQNPREAQSPTLVGDLSVELYRHLLNGFTHYFDGTFEVTKTTYSTAKPTRDPAKYGKAADPGGGYGGAGHWVRTTGGVRKTGGFWAEDEVFLYSARELPEGIYAA